MSPASGVTGGNSVGRPRRRLLSRPERRAQLVRAAARSFLRGGFSATSLDDVAAEAGVTKAIIYRHFESKRDLYLAVLLDTREGIRDHIGPPEQYGRGTLRNLTVAASEFPEGFRLLYRHARREPEFADYVDDLDAAARQAAEVQLRERIPDPARRAWIATLIPAIIIEGVLSWLDAGQPIPPDELVAVLGATNSALTTASAATPGSRSVSRSESRRATRRATERD